MGGKNIGVNVGELEWKRFSGMELKMEGWGGKGKYGEVLGEGGGWMNGWYVKMKWELMGYS